VGARNRTPSPADYAPNAAAGEGYAEMARQAHEAELDPLEAALQSIFGGRAEDIVVSHIDQITPTLMAHQVELLLRAAGGAWVKLLERIALCRASAALAKNPGEDPRLKPEKKPE
jgi:hypothetical protein